MKPDYDELDAQEASLVVGALVFLGVAVAVFLHTML